ncbi:MAG: hypothetical protein Q9191_001551 [Dirinaria sp. TL-2023a]
MEALKAEASTAPRHAPLKTMFPHPDQGVPVTEPIVHESPNSMEDLALKQQRKAQKKKARRARRGKKKETAALDIPKPGVNVFATSQAITPQPSRESEFGEQTSKADHPKSTRRQRKLQQMLETELSDILEQTSITPPDAEPETSVNPSQAPTANSTSHKISNGVTEGNHVWYQANPTPSAATSTCSFQQDSSPALRGDATGLQQKYPEFNIVPSYNVLPIAPLGTLTTPIHDVFSTPSVAHNRFGKPIKTAPFANQPARGLSTTSPPKATPYSAPNSDPQPQPAKRSPSPPKPKRQQSPAKEKPLPAPTPTPLYLSQASLEPTPLSKPQRLLLVLDLNGTLLYRSKGSSTYRARPSLQPFLEYCLNEHSVLIWSSATAPNVTTICSRLFTTAQQQQLLGKWGRNTLDLTTEQYYSKCQVYKRLDRIWDGRAAAAALQNSHPHPPAASGKWSQANTLLLDDSAAKGQAQPHNLVELPEFTRTGETDRGGKEEVLGQVVAYLEEARRWADISAFVRKWPFKVDAGWKWNWDQARKSTS